jgi:hypothetical protein
MLIETPNEPNQPAPGRTAKDSRRRWHAVLIVAPGSACAAAQACKGKRYLSTEAPRLPLANCDAAACGCKYRHFEDRRAGPRREEANGPDGKRPVTNRRKTKGRRAQD